MISARLLTFACLVFTAGCGYHVAGTTNILPTEIHTIAVTPWTSGNTQFRLTDSLSESVIRELNSRTHYRIISDPSKADAVLYGAVANLTSNTTVVDPVTGRSTGAQLVVQIQVRLIDKNGKVLFNRPNIEFRDRYEISVDPKQYFDESQPALKRLSRDIARTVVAAILENF